MINLPATLEEQIREYARQAESPNTRKAYMHDLRIFERWCREHGLSALPALPTTVAGFLADQATNGIAAQTLRRRLASIRFVHRVKKLPEPWDVDGKRMLRGILRMKGTRPRYRTPLTVDLIRQVVGQIPHTELHDRALILFGFAGAFRRSELAGLLRKDLQVVPHGLLVTIRQSKTDQLGLGQTVPILRASNHRDEARTYCPVRALDKWLAVNPSDRVFLLNGDNIARHIKRWVRRAGIDPENISAHSLRSGFITSASLAGASMLRIMEHSRHKNVSVVRSYFHAEHFKHHPGEGLLEED